VVNWAKVGCNVKGISEEAGGEIFGGPPHDKIPKIWPFVNRALKTVGGEYGSS